MLVHQEDLLLGVGHPVWKSEDAGVGGVDPRRVSDPSYATWRCTRQNVVAAQQVDHPIGLVSEKTRQSIPLENSPGAAPL